MSSDRHPIIPLAVQDEPARRRFLKLMAASAALAGTACSGPPAETIVPYTRMPEQGVPGLPLFYATAFVRRGYAHGVLVETNMGRPTKVEGNPEHPLSAGATDVFAQASILQLWDPERSQTVQQGGALSTWQAFEAALAECRPRFGKGLRILTGEVTSPTLAAQLDAITARYPEARWHAWEPLHDDGAAAATAMAFGHALDAVYSLERVDVLLTLDADLFGAGPASVAHARAFTAARRLGARPGANRLYALESTPTLTGAYADARLARAPQEVEAALWRMAGVLGVGSAEVVAPDAASARWEAAVVQALRGARGRALVVAGPSLSAASRALVCLLNRHLGAEQVGAVAYIEPVARSAPDHGASIAELAADMHAGRVDTLLMLDTNPVYNAPPELEFAGGLRRVPCSVHLGLYRDETARSANWHLPMAHCYEAWSDARAADGTASIVQPLIAPLYGGRSAHAVLAAVSGQDSRDGRALVQATWRAAHAASDFDDFWRESLRRGVVPGSAARPVTVHPASSAQPATARPQQGMPASSAQAVRVIRPSAEQGIPALSAQALSVVRPGAEQGMPASSAQSIRADGGGWSRQLAQPSQLARASTGERPAQDSSPPLVAVFTADPAVDDGEFSNNAWLQELPRPLTSLTWDNAALIAPATAARVRVTDGDVVRLTVDGRTLDAPILILPEQAEGVITLPLGYGRSAAGSVGDAVGFNAYSLRTRAAMHGPVEVQLTRTGLRHTFALRQREVDMHDREPVREIRPGQPAQQTENLPQVSLYPEREYTEYKWGMSIDLNTCIGCGACTVACQAENNIPVVGKEEVIRGRSMHWIRVDRYRTGTRTLFQPVPCMHCEHAPCEEVCPVGATVHDSEGLNVQVYNRCIGTRYCSNNCPYKVRRFNFLQYANQKHESLKALQNPEVTVRRRGVMEKCSYCLQRITRTRIEAEKQGRRIADGEVVTACQGVCPTSAIRFGDLNDPHSEVVAAKASPLNYVLLEELNTRPRTSYAARVHLPDKELE